ncbi:hypothetical protein GE061_014423 [Apolygus lucorum]|uniref:Uncharacterized protein n=1 Tax=Apolygus lucorum TaxID=248454 RepID=A0A6A4K4H1_APOLU|nr:hypothetical protein GE061_014423 [Apolygus lucorum]
MNKCTRILNCSVSNMVGVKLLSAKSNVFSPEALLTEDTIDRTIKKIKDMKVAQRPLTDENSKRAAVLIPLCLVKDELSLLYTLRNADLKRHKGQVSFPGGMADSTDDSLRTTALRETEEEIGVNRKDVTVWGEGNIYVGKEFSVMPVVGYLGKIEVEKMKVNPDEVAEVFAVPLKHFTDPANCKHTQFRFKGSCYVIPAYVNAKHRIWGITALLTHVFLTAFIPDYYRHKIYLIKPIKAAL